MLQLSKKTQELRILTGKGPDIVEVQKKLNQWKNEYDLLIGQPTINDDNFAVIVIRERKGSYAT